MFFPGRQAGRRGAGPLHILMIAAALMLSAAQCRADITGFAPLPGGANGQVQWNNGYSFDGIAGSSVSGSTPTLAGLKLTYGLQASTGAFSGNLSVGGTLTASVSGLSGILGLAHGGTNADLSATGGSHSFLKQASSGAAITVTQPACGDLSDASAFCNGTDAAGLSGTVASGRLSGSYTGITGVGTLAAGTWNGTAIGTQYGGTGQNWSSVAAGSLPKFTASGTMGVLPAPASGAAILFGVNWSTGTLQGTANQVTVTPGSSGIVLSTPQDIGTGSSPTFVTLNATTLKASSGIQVGGPAAQTRNIDINASSPQIGLRVGDTEKWVIGLNSTSWAGLFNNSTGGWDWVCNTSGKCSFSTTVSPTNATILLPNNTCIGWLNNSGTSSGDNSICTAANGNLQLDPQSGETDIRDINGTVAASFNTGLTAAGAQFTMTGLTAGTTGYIFNSAASPGADAIEVKSNGTLVWQLNPGQANGVQPIQLTSVLNASTTGQILNSAASPTADLLEAKSNGTLFFQLNPGQANGAAPHILMTALNASTTGQILNAAASATADILQTKVNGTLKSIIDSAGRIGALTRPGTNAPMYEQNGTSNGTFAPSGFMWSTVVSSSTKADTTEIVGASTGIPAGVLANNGDCLLIMCGGAGAATATTKQLAIRWNTTTLSSVDGTIIANTGAVTTNGVLMNARATICKSNSNAQVVRDAIAIAAGTLGTQVATPSLTATDTGVINVACTIKNGTGNLADTLLKVMTIEKKPAP